jgi:photosystem II stability/assembly factor-like uncharacterized protein
MISGVPLLPSHRIDRILAVIRRASFSLLLGLTALPAALFAQLLPAAEDIDGLEWRAIGPAEMGGRTVDIAAIPGDPSTVYFATASGGLWRTTNHGVTWSSIFESGGTLSLGAVTLAPSDVNVVYLGTGENNPRNSTSIGDGAYKSTDGGDSWTHIGLEDTERVARIRVHPTDPDLVYVAALGHAWGPNEERGVFRSRDGGATWEKVLYVDENTGAADLAIDPGNPRVLYATMYDYRRRPYNFRSGGPGSGLYKSTDAGTTWTRLNDGAPGNGLPTGELGRIGVAVAASEPDIVYALIESHDDGVLWRSEDGGQSWSVVSEQRSLNSRPFYYSDLRVDPTDPNRLFAVSGALSRSEDGGRTWERIAANIHGDHQSFWIDPLDPDRLIDGNDGGFHFSYDGGDTWEFNNRVPLAQFYQITADMREPYYVCGGLQDNDSWCGPSSTRTVAGPLQNYWQESIGPGDGMYVQIDPRDPDVMYANSQGGNLFKVDRGTGEARSIQPYPVSRGGAAAGDHPYRFNWNSPIHLSPHDPSTVYFGGNVLFRTEDGGNSWEEISPDLTRAEPEKLVSSGGEITPDNTTAETHATIYTVAESPVEAGVIWVGTDDGNLQITRDGGGSWENVVGNVPDIPDGSWVSRVEASRVVGGRAYVTFDRHRDDDMRPWVFRTDDHGRNWENVTGDLPARGYAHVVREDPRNSDLVYVGTELGIFASWTRGGQWVDIRLGLPRVAVRDILVHPRDNDLIIGTHGLSIFIMDDVSPLQEMSQAVADGPTIFTPRAATRFEPWAARFRFDLGDGVFVGENLPYGAGLAVYLPPEEESEEAGASESAGGGQDADDERQRGEETEDDSAASDSVRVVITGAAGDTVRVLRAERRGGVTRLAWDLREEGAHPPEERGAYRFGPAAARVLPGDYTVSLSTDREGETAASKAVRVVLDSRIDWDPDLAGQQSALRTLYAHGQRGAEAVRALDEITEQLGALSERLAALDEDHPGGALSGAVDSLTARVDSVRESLARDDSERPGSEAVLSKIQGIYGQIARSTNGPTVPQAEWGEEFASELDAVLQEVEQVIEVEVPRLNDRIRDAGVTFIGSG